MKLEKILLGLSLTTPVIGNDIVFTGNKSYSLDSLPVMAAKALANESQVSVTNPFTSSLVNFYLDGKDFSLNDTWYINLVDASGNVYGSDELDSTGFGSIQLELGLASITNPGVILSNSTILYPMLVQKDTGVFELTHEIPIIGDATITETVVDAPCVLYDSGLDTDSDGITDVQESVLGLNKDIRDSLSITYFLSEDNFVFTFPAVTGPSYTVLKTTDLDVPFVAVEPKFRVRSNQIMEYVSPLDSSNAAFYKVEFSFQGSADQIKN